MLKRSKIRRFLTLAPISFARIAMYRDLDPANWAAILAGGASAHPLVRPLLRGTADDSTGGGFAGEYIASLSGLRRASACTPDCPPCTADFNGDGGVDGADVQAFFETWESGSTCGDANGDGGVDGGDVEHFMLAWEAGGC
jgi:hypothetical protein